MTDSADSLRQWLLRLGNCYGQLDRPAEVRRAAMLASSVDSDRQIKIVVVGEFNSGKSTLVNALCGMSVLPAGIIPTTATINIVDYAPSPNIVVCYADGTRDDLPFTADALQQFTARNGDQSKIREVHVGIPNLAPGLVLVDTPGVNDINQTRSEIVYGMIPEADVVVFLMDVQQPLKRSEVDFLRNRVLATSIVRTIFVLNHIDRVSNLNDVRAAVDYVRNGLRSIYAEIAQSFTHAGSEQLAFTLRDAVIPVFAVSAKRMLHSTVTGQAVDGDPDGLRSELVNLVSPESRLHAVLDSVGGQALGLAMRLRREIGEQLARQGAKRDETLEELRKNTGVLRHTLDAARTALSKIESRRTALRGETDSRVDSIFRDASASVAALLGSNGAEKGLQVVQQEIARNLESRMAALNGEMQKLALDCAQQAAAFTPMTSAKPNLRIDAPHPSHQERDWLADMLNDPVKGAAFWVLAPAVPFLFGPIGLLLVALPFVARLFAGNSNNASIQRIQSEMAKSCEDIKTQLRATANSRLDSISVAVLDIFDEIQGRIRGCCGVISGDAGIAQTTLLSLQTEAALLESELSRAMAVEPPAISGLFCWNERVFNKSAVAYREG